MKKNKTENLSGILKESEHNEKAMLEKFATEISKKFHIEEKEALALIKNKTLESLDNLKNQINENEESNLGKLNKSELEKLFLILKGAQRFIENFSKAEIKVLRNDVEQNIDIENFSNYLEKHLPPRLVEKAKDPKLLHEHILGFTLGTANSIISVLDTFYQIGTGIIKTPYHLYLIISGKGEIDGLKEI